MIRTPVKNSVKPPTTNASPRLVSPARKECSIDLKGFSGAIQEYSLEELREAIAAGKERKGKENKMICKILSKEISRRQKKS